MKGSERVLQTVFTDIDTYIQFMRVAHLMDSPSAMLSPRVLRAIARGGARGGARAEGPRVADARSRADTPRAGLGGAAGPAR